MPLACSSVFVTRRGNTDCSHFQPRIIAVWRKFLYVSKYTFRKGPPPPCLLRWRKVRARRLGLLRLTVFLRRITLPIQKVLASAVAFFIHANGMRGLLSSDRLRLCKPPGRHFSPCVHALVRDLDRASGCTPRIESALRADLKIPCPSLFINKVKPEPSRNEIASSKSSQLVLIEWQPGQSIPRHAHPGLLCWMRVLTGTLFETIYGKNGMTDTRCLSPAIPLVQIPNSSYEHELTNNRLTPALSLHYYVKKSESEA